MKAQGGWGEQRRVVFLYPRPGDAVFLFIFIFIIPIIVSCFLFSGFFLCCFYFLSSSRGGLLSQPADCVCVVCVWEVVVSERGRGEGKPRGERLKRKRETGGEGTAKWKRSREKTKASGRMDGLAGGV